MCIGKEIDDDAKTLDFNDLAITNSKEVEVLGVTLDRNMNFHTHTKNICRKRGQKLSALLKISPYLDQGKKILLFKSMIKSQFIYSVLWFGYFAQGNQITSLIKIMKGV